MSYSSLIAACQRFINRSAVTLAMNREGECGTMEYAKRKEVMYFVSYTLLKF